METETHQQTTTKPKTGRMCESHNKEAMRHLLEIDGCDGWCNASDPCPWMMSAVSKCRECGISASPVRTHNFYYMDDNWIRVDDTGVLPEHDEEVPYTEVEAYATTTA